MRTLTAWIKTISLIAALTALSACANSNGDSNVSLVDSNGKHPADWVARHGAIAAPSTSPCTECHGADLDGGIARVSCMSATAISGFRCHVTSPAANPTGCVSCHGGATTGPTGTAAPNRQGAHAKHLALPDITCNSCHLGAGSGTVGHAKATASGDIASATVSPLDVSFQAKTFTRFGYDATSGTCSGIVCHGGQTTPNWNGGTITVATDCLKCHEQGTSSQTPQYNSFFSGTAFGANLHLLHMQLKVPSTTTPIFCTDCHNATVLAAKHFTGLATPTFEVTAASTIGGTGTRVNTYVPFTATVPSGSCSSSCHITNGNNPRNWIN